MADSIVNNITDQQQENAPEFERAKVELEEKNSELRRIEAELRSDDSMSSIASMFSSEDDKTEFLSKFWETIDSLGLIIDWEISNPQSLWKAHKYLEDLVNRVQVLQGDSDLEQNRELLGRLKIMQGDFLNLLGETREIIAHVLPAQTIGTTEDLDRLTNLDEIEGIKETGESPKDIFKLPVQSVRGFFKDEVERNLLMQADRDGRFMSDILGLRSSWWELKDLYNRASSENDLHSTPDDTFDNARFQDLIDDLTSQRSEHDWDSKDLADFLVESRKVIGALKRRMNYEVWEQSETEEERAEKARTKADLISILVNLNVWNQNNLNAYQTNYLIELTKREEKKAKERKTNLDEKIKSKESELKNLQDAIDKMADGQTKTNAAWRITTATTELGTLKTRFSDTKTNLTNLENARSVYEKAHKEEWEGGMKLHPDVKKLNKIEDSINKIINETKIDGERTLLEVKGDIEKKYATLETKQRRFKKMLLNDDFSPEQLAEYDEEVKKARDELDDLTLEHLGKGFDEEVMRKIKLQEKDVYEQLQLLMESDDLNLAQKLQDNANDEKKQLEEINKFFKDKRVRRLRDLHDSMGHFSSPEREAKYIRFMNQNDQKYQRDADNIANFHSTAQQRMLDGAFGVPPKGVDSIKGGWNKFMGIVNWMSNIKEKDVSGGLGVCKKTVNVLGTLGYDTAKIWFHYPSKWLGRGFRKISQNKTLDWLAKAPESKGLFGFVSKIAKLPVRLVGVPIQQTLKWADFALTQAANAVWGEINLKAGKGESMVSQGALDKVIDAMTPDQVNDVWSGIFEGITQTVGFSCEKFYNATWVEKKKTIAKFLEGKDLKAGRKAIQKLGNPVYARNAVRGTY